MVKMKINELPRLTYRYVKTNDTSVEIKEAPRCSKSIFSDMTYVSTGGELPSTFKGASDSLLALSQKNGITTICIPDGISASLQIMVQTTEGYPDFRSAFSIYVGEKASLSLVWVWDGNVDNSEIISATYYEVKKQGTLKVSILERNLSNALWLEQRYTLLYEEANAEFASAMLGGEKIIVHSIGDLHGQKSNMTETAVYALKGTQHQDLFYHINHMGKESTSCIDVKGSLSGNAKKVFRGTLDFKRGCSGSVGEECDYVIQLDSTTKNISLPLLLCTEDDVMGNHASSAGQLDANIIYYLMTRGFTWQEARRIMVESLIGPLIDKMDEGLRAEVLESIRYNLEAREDA